MTWFRGYWTGLVKKSKSRWWNQILNQ